MPLTYLANIRRKRFLARILRWSTPGGGSETAATVRCGPSYKGGKQSSQPTRFTRSALSREDDARSLVRDLFRSPEDITPDANNGELRIAIHSFANPRSNRAIRALLAEINAAELTDPGTRRKLRYTFPSGADDEKPTT